VFGVTPHRPLRWLCDALELEHAERATNHLAQPLSLPAGRFKAGVLHRWAIPANIPVKPDYVPETNHDALLVTLSTDASRGTSTRGNCCTRRSSGHSAGSAPLLSLMCR